MAAKYSLALTFPQIAANGCGQRGALDEAGNLLVVQTIDAHLLSLSCHLPEERATSDTGTLHPGL